MYYYLTMCEHSVRSPGPVSCLHGPMTLGSSSSQPLGKVYTGVLICDAEGV